MPPCQKSASSGRERLEGRQPWARAVARAQGWLYDTPGKFLKVMGNAADQTGNNRINVLTGSAHILRDNSKSGSELNYETIKEHVDRVAELLDLLVLLTQNNSAP